MRGFVLETGTLRERGRGEGGLFCFFALFRGEGGQFEGNSNCDFYCTVKGIGFCDEY